MSRKNETEIQDFSGVRVFQIPKNVFHGCEISKKQYVAEMKRGFVLFYVEYPGVSNDKIIGFGSQGHIRKSPTHANYLFSVFVNMKSKKILIQNEAEYRACGLFFSIYLP